MSLLTSHSALLTAADSFAELDADDRLFAEQPKRLDRVARGTSTFHSILHPCNKVSSNSR